MADYKRLVSYIYNYEYGQRKNNVGFSRVESRNEKCKVTIHVRLSVASNQPVKVYLIHRDGGTLEGVLLGEMFSKNGTGDFRVETDSSSLMGTRYGLEDICGIILYVSQNLFLGSQWDDKPISLTDFFAYDEKKHQLMSDMASEEKKDDYDSIQVSPQPVEDQIMEEMLAREVKNNETSASSTESSEQEEFQTTRVMKEVPQEEIMNAADLLHSQGLKEDMDSKLEEESASSVELISESESEEQVEAQQYTEETVTTEPVEEELQAEELEETSIGEDDDSTKVYMQSCGGDTETEKSAVPPSCPKCVECMFANFPCVEPFGTKNTSRWAKIEPKDIGVLPVEVWILANNSFLLHGYYNYRHLLFGAIPVNTGWQYVIAVPGTFHSTERTMAAMFGFDRFLSTKQEQAQVGDFGYWIQQVVL